MTDSPCPAAGFCASIDRRTLLTRAALAAAAAALAACGVSDATAPTSLSPLVLDLDNYPQLASVGGVALVTADASPIAVVRTGESAFVALSRICPHQGATINTSGTGFECPRHQARFTSSGAWTGGQRTSNMRSYPTVFDATANTVTIG